MRFPIRLAAVLLACGFGVTNAAGPTYFIDAHVVSAGSSASLSSPCFRMQATIAEPVAGFSSSTTYSLSAGFLAGVPNAGDEIFFSGFEACP